MDDLEPIAGYPTKHAMLTALYVEEGLSIHQVADRIGVSTATVERWLRLLEIPKRSRGGRNNSTRIGWTLHRLDPRLVFALSLKDLALIVQGSESRCYKYREQVKRTWTSALSAQQQDSNVTRP